jgi:hypothetical protein
VSQAAIFRQQTRFLARTPTKKLLVHVSTAVPSINLLPLSFDHHPVFHVQQQFGATQLHEEQAVQPLDKRRII